MIMRRQQYRLQPSLSMASLRDDQEQKSYSTVRAIIPVSYIIIEHLQVTLPHISNHLGQVSAKAVVELSQIER